MKRKFNIMNSWPYLFDHLMHTFAQTDTNTEAIANINHQKKTIKDDTTDYFYLFVAVRSFCLRRLK